MIMANVATVPAQGQILVDIEDMSMLKDIKRAIGLMRGVGKITVPRRKRMSSYERSLRDLDEGRVYEYDSLDDLIKEIGG
jgi:hypothetical protein